MNINNSIFKSYDIRGVYPEEINEEAAKYLAQAFVNLVLVKLNNGAQVDDLGLISTNDYYFAMGHYKYDGGLMATASHTPPEYGGFKMTIFDTKLANSFEFISGKALLEEVN